MRRRKGNQKLFVSLLALSLLFSGIPAGTANAAENGQTMSAQMPFTELTVDEMVAEMGNGWNLGNTMDGHTGFTPSETLWQNVETTQELLKAIHDMGFNTVRVPVTWGTMIDDENGYAINEKWMSRVQDIVDYAVNMNMYVIINVHHDGAEQSGWLRIAAEDLGPVKAKFAGVWKNIAERFKDYDEHVIFESMNEVTGGTSDKKKEISVINELNQIFVNTVRETGSNNAYRWLSCPGRYTNIADTTNEDLGYKLPNDTVENRLFVAVHYYDLGFGLSESMSATEFPESKVKALIEDFKLLQEDFTSKGIPVILGEYGAFNKNNTEQRVYHMEVVTRLCQQMGIVPCYWDQGWYDLTKSPDFSYTLVDRETLEQIYPEIIQAMMRGFFVPGNADLMDIQLSPAVTGITDLGTVNGTYLLKMGEVEKITLDVERTAANDVVLWKSADETVATVNPFVGSETNWTANIHATGIGNTVITAYSQSGSAILEIPVEVQAAETTVPCTEITAEKESYELTKGQSLYLNAGMAPADTDAFLTYRSSDTDIISVSKIGKIVAKGVGSASVIITSSDGLTKVVPVTVSEAAQVQDIALALNVYFNDEEHNFFSNECGSAITVNADGQYTLAFDCGDDLSDKAKDAGVTGLNNLTAIYIKDDSVTKGETKKTPLSSCDIIYDKIVVDGEEYTVHMDAPKSALKSSGILDTNDPINSWDGSVIEEVEVKNHVLNFAGLENPQRVEVTFTLSNMVFAQSEEVAANAATAIEASGGVNLSVSGSEIAQVSVKLTPAEAGKVFFVSSDASKVSVNNSAVVASDGSVSVAVYAHGDGEAVVTAYTNNGLTAEFTVTAQDTDSKQYANVAAKEETAPADGTENGVESGTTSGTEDGATDETPDTATKSGGGINLVLVVVGIIALGAVVFFVTLKVAGGTGKKKE